MLYITDERLRVTAIVDEPLETVWEERLIGAGAVRAVLPMRYAEVAQKGRYLTNSPGGETAIIDEVTTDGTGRVTIRGRDIVGLLEDRVLTHAMAGGEEMTDAISEAIAEAFDGVRGVPCLRFEGAKEKSGVICEGAEMGEDLLSFCQRALGEIGMRLCGRMAQEEDAIVLSVEAMADASERVIYAQGDAAWMALKKGMCNGANLAYVGGEDASGAAMTLTVTGGAPGARREIFVDGTRIKRVYRNAAGVKVTRSEEEYHALLIGYGLAAIEGQQETVKVYVSEAGGGANPSEGVRVGDTVTVRGGENAVMGRVLRMKRTKDGGGVQTEVTLRVLKEE